jgi:putative SOS response-associated peptidase YedK
MCGRFSLAAGMTTVAQRFRLLTPTAESAAWTAHYNIAPTKTVVVVGDDGTRYLAQMRWGLIPSWATDPAIGNRMINARAETVATKPAFRVALRKHRCLVVADGFYEFI